MQRDATTKRILLASLALSLSTAYAGNGQDDDREAMVELAWKRGCFNCHEVDTKLRGPAWLDVAERYRGDDTAFETLVAKVRDGGSGNWGDDYMSPNRRVPEEDIRTLVGWLLMLDKDSWSK